MRGRSGRYGDLKVGNAERRAWTRHVSKRPAFLKPTRMFPSIFGPPNGRSPAAVEGIVTLVDVAIQPEALLQVSTHADPRASKWPRVPGADVI
ncbi:hypothetical protein CC2G_003912 [Coprinopsis cinerea AmutBmut pab1-1]|nr:hypothetical protein CC2G_003912 [Coprinopsis cinerea AmutBmut pab1-1]